MIYEDENMIRVDTRELDYTPLWDRMGLNRRQTERAEAVIELFNSATYSDGFRIITQHTPYSELKSFRREDHRHSADHYRTRQEIESAAHDKGLVRRLIDIGLLELHPKLAYSLATHTQAPYRLNAIMLFEMRKLELGEHEELNYDME